MPEIPPAVLTAVDAALNELPQPESPFERDRWRIVSRVTLEAASPLLAEAWGAFECEPLRTEGATAETEWGMRHDDCLTDVHDYGRDEEAARRSVADHARLNGRLVRRTVTYGPWEEVPGDR